MTTLPPIMIHGIACRSGTNLLHQLLLLHPECTEHAGPVREACLVEPSHLLMEYADRVLGKWNPTWGVTEQDREDLTTYIGSGMVRFLARQSEPGKRLVCKTPSVTNLANAPLLFPGAQFVIIVRDGRDVVESTRRSWGRPFETTAREWASAAFEIQRFLESDAGRKTAMLVKYEALFEERASTARRLLEFLGLDTQNFPFDELPTMPIYGSSDHATWKKEPLRNDFSPRGRWECWTKREHREFNRIAADAMELMGYSVQQVGSSRESVLHRIFSRT